MYKDKKKWIILLIALTIALSAMAQLFTRDFRQAEGPFYQGSNYRAIDISETDEYFSVSWKRWLLDDINVSDMDNLLNMKTQKDQNLSGYFVNAVVDSTRFNHAAAMKVCPQGWRLPRIGEFDSLLHKISYNQRTYMFGNKMDGFKGFRSDTITGKVFKKTQHIKGGFWWCQETNSENTKAYVVKIGENMFYEVGMADIWDLASVRCIKKEDNE
jgi:uncharacterized protein (TIGR02145 family)